MEGGGQSEFKRPPPPYRLPSYGVWRPRGTSWSGLSLFHACPPMSSVGLPSISCCTPRRGGPGEPRASRLACRPALTNTTWPSRRGAAGTVVEEEDDNAGGKAEDLAPPPGGLGALGG